MRVNQKISFLLLLILGGCSLFRSYDERTFSFNYDGDEYEIISKFQGENVLENVLVMYDENGEIIIEGIDEDSDGAIDELQQGEISLSELNRIYYAGIEQAFESGNLDSKNELRMFEFQDPPFIYRIETIGYDDYRSRTRMVYGYMKEVSLFNKFIIIQTENEREIILRDLDVDGRLDIAVRPENTDISNYQSVYREILGEGLSSDRIVRIDQMYIVLPSQQLVN